MNRENDNLIKFIEEILGCHFNKYQKQIIISAYNTNNFFMPCARHDKFLTIKNLMFFYKFLIEEGKEE